MKVYRIKKRVSAVPILTR